MEITAFDLAQRFVGTKEIAGTLRNNPQILAMLRLDNDWPKDDEVAWCSAFVNYICWLLRLPRSKSLSARSWLNVGIPIEVYIEAQVGFDIVVLWRKNKDGPWGHVGFFAGFSTDAIYEPSIYILGGNQDNQVKISEYPNSRLLGIRRLL